MHDRLKNKTARLRRALPAAAILFATASGFAQHMGPDFGARGDDSKGSIELVDPKTLRVCADPNNLPFSNEKGEGFENKIAEFWPRSSARRPPLSLPAPGSACATRTPHLYDTDPLPAWRSAPAPSTSPFFTPPAPSDATRARSPPDRLASLIAPERKPTASGRPLVPPREVLAMQGLMGAIKPYPLMVDTRVESLGAAMVHDLEKGDIDVALLWGPIAGFYAKQSATKLTVTPLPETPGARMAFRIAFGVRHSDQNWKRELNTLIAQNKSELERILLDYGVPLIDDAGHTITVTR